MLPVLYACRQMPDASGLLAVTGLSPYKIEGPSNGPFHLKSYDIPTLGSVRSSPMRIASSSPTSLGSKPFSAASLDAGPHLVRRSVFLLSALTHEVTSTPLTVIVCG